MQPITREIIDRRQPAIRWSAVLAGTAIAVGLWGVFQLLGIGAGLTALDPDDARSAHHAALGMGAWSVLSPLIATFVGGFVAARLSGTFDRKVGVGHGLVVWGLTTAAGILVTLWMASAAAVGVAHARNADNNNNDVRAATDMNVGSSDARLYRDAEDALAPINARLRTQGKAEVSPNALIAAARAANTDDGFDSDKFIEKLDDKSSLDKAGATEVANQLGPRASSLIHQVPLATANEHDRMAAAEATGKGLLTLSLAMLLSIGTAIAGALVAMRSLFDRDRHGNHPHTTAPYPVATPPEHHHVTTYPPVTPER
jgi:hypothetical protein